MISAEDRALARKIVACWGRGEGYTVHGQLTITEDLYYALMEAQNAQMLEDSREIDMLLNEDSFIKKIAARVIDREKEQEIADYYQAHKEDGEWERVDVER